MISFKRLKDIREDNDMSQSRLANKLGVTRSAYSLWELGINIIPLNYLCDFADCFNVSLDYILGLTNNKGSNNFVVGFDVKVLGSNMKEIRLKNNLTQEAMSDILGVSQACVVRYEKGLICISISNIYKFSKKFKVSINELCGKSKEREYIGV